MSLHFPFTVNVLYITMKDERWFINLGHPFSRALFSVFSIDVLPSRGPCSFFISSLLTLESASSSHTEFLKLIDNAYSRYLENKTQTVPLCDNRSNSTIQNYFPAKTTVIKQTRIKVFTFIWTELLKHQKDKYEKTNFWIMKKEELSGKKSFLAQILQESAFLMRKRGGYSILQVYRQQLPGKWIVLSENNTKIPLSIYFLFTSSWLLVLFCLFRPLLFPSIV